MEETTRLTEAIRELLDGGRDERLADVLAEAHPADVSGVIRELALEDQVRVFRLLTPQQAGAVLAELDDPILRELIGSLDEAGVSCPHTASSPRTPRRRSGRSAPRTWRASRWTPTRRRSRASSSATT